MRIANKPASESAPGTHRPEERQQRRSGAGPRLAAGDFVRAAQPFREGRVDFARRLEVNFEVPAVRRELLAFRDASILDRDRRLDGEHELVPSRRYAVCRAYRRILLFRSAV